MILFRTCFTNLESKYSHFFDSLWTVISGPNSEDDSMPGSTVFPTSTNNTTSVLFGLKIKL